MLSLSVTDVLSTDSPLYRKISLPYCSCGFYYKGHTSDVGKCGLTYCVCLGHTVTIGLFAYFFQQILLGAFEPSMLDEIMFKAGPGEDPMYINDLVSHQ